MNFLGIESKFLTVSNDLGPYGSCVQRGLAKSLDQSLIDLHTAMLTFPVETLLCATEADKCVEMNGTIQFTYGLLNGLVSQLDIAAMKQAFLDMAIQMISNSYDCFFKGELTGAFTGTITPHNLVRTYVKCWYGIDMGSEADIVATFDKIWTYVGTHYNNHYVQGQVAAFLITLVIPYLNTLSVVKAAKASLISRLKFIAGGTEAANIERIAAASAEEVGTVLDDLAKAGAKKSVT